MLQFLRGTSSQLSNSQTIFSDGQPVFERDSGQLKIGNGVDTFKNLPYVGANSSSFQVSADWYGMKVGYVDLSENSRLAVFNYATNFGSNVTNKGDYSLSREFEIDMDDYLGRGDLYSNFAWGTVTCDNGDWWVARCYVWYLSSPVIRFRLAGDITPNESFSLLCIAVTYK